MSTTNDKPIVSRPKDKSLASYKAWIQEITEFLKPGAKTVKTEEQWEEGWRKFWSKASEGPKE